MSAATVDGVSLEARLREALNEVLDPCSVGRNVPAGLVDMGMIRGVRHRPLEGGGEHVVIELQLTSPACTFQLYFDEHLRGRLEEIEEVEEVEIVWRSEFDWTDDDMSEALKQRFRARRELLLRDDRRPGRPADTR
jgi:metal-sulfur cluster biosynthetic enzyme